MCMSKQRQSIILRVLFWILGVVLSHLVFRINLYIIAVGLQLWEVDYMLHGVPGYYIANAEAFNGDIVRSTSELLPRNY